MPLPPREFAATQVTTVTEAPSSDIPDRTRPGESFPAQEHPAVQEPVTEPVPQYPPGDQPGEPGHTPTTPPPVTALA